MEVFRCKRMRCRKRSVSPYRTKAPRARMAPLFWRLVLIPLRLVFDLVSFERNPAGSARNTQRRSYRRSRLSRREPGRW
jgi:hypothetical protein